MISAQLFKVVTLLLPIVINARIPSTTTTTVRYNHDDIDTDLHDYTVSNDIGKDIELQISASQSSSQQLSNINNPSTFIITIESTNTIDNKDNIIDINDILSSNNNELFSEDYWYSFQPLKSIELKVDGKLQNDEKRRYKVHRVLKQSIANGIVNESSGRRLQSEEESSVGSDKVEESNNSIDKSKDTNNTEEPSEQSKGEEEYIELVTNSLLSLVCVTMAALAAGLTMGMLSLDVSILFVFVIDLIYVY